MDIGDKQPSFVGSKQWIGSMELGWVLEEWYKVCSIFNIHYLDQNMFSLLMSRCFSFSLVSCLVKRVHELMHSLITIAKHLFIHFFDFDRTNSRSRASILRKSMVSTLPREVFVKHVPYELIFLTYHSKRGSWFTTLTLKALQS